MNNIFKRNYFSYNEDGGKHRYNGNMYPAEKNEAYKKNYYLAVSHDSQRNILIPPAWEHSAKPTMEWYLIFLIRICDAILADGLNTNRKKIKEIKKEVELFQTQNELEKLLSHNPLKKEQREKIEATARTIFGFIFCGIEVWNEKGFYLEVLSHRQLTHLYDGFLNRKDLVGMPGSYHQIPEYFG